MKIIEVRLRFDIPERKQEPSRKRGLWEIVFRAFRCRQGLRSILGIQSSPSEEWNVFRFEHYRNERYADKLREEPLVASLPFRTQRQSGSFLLDVEFSLDKLIRKDRLLEIGIGAIMKFNKDKTHWALTRCGSVPDFHSRDSFIIKL